MLNGERISQLLSSGMEHPKENMIVEHSWDLFSKEEDVRLLAAHEEYGNQWTRIARESGNRHKNAIRTRIQSLKQASINHKHRERGMFPFRLDDSYWFNGGEPPSFEDFLALINPLE